MFTELDAARWKRTAQETGAPVELVRVVACVKGAIGGTTGLGADEITAESRMADICGDDTMTFDLIVGAVQEELAVEIHQREMPQGRDFELFPDVESLISFFYGKTAAGIRQ